MGVEVSCPNWTDAFKMMLGIARVEKEIELDINNRPTYPRQIIA